MASAYAELGIFVEGGGTLDATVGEDVYQRLASRRPDLGPQRTPPMLLPIRTVTRPAVLTGQRNGRLADELLVDTPGPAGGPTVRLVAPAAAAWRALCAAATAAGHTLKATSLVDSYRPYEVQERVFLERYTTTPIPGSTSRKWRGKTWFLKPGNAPAAAPGTSNHGWGLAIDVGEERDTDSAADSLDEATLAWLIEHEQTYGFSHEIQSEPWHIRYFAGDAILVARSLIEGDDVTPRELLDSLIKIQGIGDIRYEDWANRVLVRLPHDLAARLDGLAAAAAADVTRDAAMLAAVQALATAGGVDAAPIVAAVREEAAKTRMLVEQLQAQVREQDAEIEQLRSALADGAHAQTHAAQTPTPALAAGGG